MTAEQIFISSQGRQWGPYSSRQVQFLLGKGSFQLSDWAWAGNVGDWVALGDLLKSLCPPEPQPATPASARPAVLVARVVQPMRAEKAVVVPWWKDGLFRKFSVAAAVGLVGLLVLGWGGETADYSQLERRDGLAYAPGSDTPFEGKAVSFHANGQRMYSAEFVAGKEEGRIVSWYANGKKQSEAEMRDGEFHGQVTYWHSNGQMMGHYTYEHGHVTVRQDWDPDGNTYQRK